MSNKWLDSMSKMFMDITRLARRKANKTIRRIMTIMFNMTWGNVKPPS